MLGLGDRPRRLLEAVKGWSCVELPGAEECCGFGGTFAVKNPDVSAAMGADKVRNVESTGAEVLCAADNSCLMHIGGTLTRQRLRRAPGAHRRDPGEHRRGAACCERHVSGHARPSRRPPPKPYARHASCAATCATPPTPSAPSARRPSRSWPTGRSCARRAQRSRTTRCAISTTIWCSWRRRSPRRAATVHWAADADEANRIVTELVQATGETRGRQGQVDGHAGDRPQRGAGRGRASPPTRPTSPS